MRALLELAEARCGESCAGLDRRELYDVLYGVGPTPSQMRAWEAYRAERLAHSRVVGVVRDRRIVYWEPRGR